MKNVRRVLQGAVIAVLVAAMPACATSSDAPAAASTAEAVTTWSSSFASLADARVPAAMAAVQTSVAAFGESTLPHQAKALRKQVGELRDYIDLFAAAYDKRGPGDPWIDLRKDLDVGYETIGAFKDLFDAQGENLAVVDPATGSWGPGVRPDEVTYPDEDKVAKRRRHVLEWRTGFLEHVASYTAYVAHADAREMHEHGDDQSRFFWAGAGVEPELSKSGLENLSVLVRSLLGLAGHDLDDIKGLDKVTDVDDHETFHDLRKRVRAIVKVLGYYPELLEPGADAPLKLADELVDRYGSLNDKISAHDLLHDRDEKKRLGDKINDEWKDLRKWQRHENVAEQLDALEHHVKKHG